MLRATIGPGYERFEREILRDRQVLRAYGGNGLPDYLYAPRPDEMHFLYLAADRALDFRRGPNGWSEPTRREPIPDALLWLVDEDDREEVLARRVDVSAHLAAQRPGWCRDPAEAPGAGACLQSPAVANALDTIRATVLQVWDPPPILHGGDRVIVRFRVEPDGALGEHCVLGATNPKVALSALDAFAAAFPIAPPMGKAACLIGLPLSVRFEIETD
jgi:hypothetical protein